MNAPVRTILPLLIIAIVAGAAVWWFTETARSEAISVISAAAAEQEEDLVATLALLDNNTADEETAALVRDCTGEERATFDRLLSRLDAGLSNEELAQLQSLYDRCGNFFALRRLVLADRFGQMADQYRTLLTLVGELRPLSGSQTARMRSWQTIAEKEKQISEHFSRLSAIQGEIIEELMAGQKPGSQSIQTLLTEVQNHRDSIDVLTIEIDAARALHTDL